MSKILLQFAENLRERASGKQSSLNLSIFLFLCFFFFIEKYQSLLNFESSWRFFSAEFSDEFSFRWIFLAQLSYSTFICSVSWGCRIHWLHLCRGVSPPPPNEYPGYDTKQSDGEVPAVLEIWGMQSTPSLPGPLWPGVVAPDRAPSMG